MSQNNKILTELKKPKLILSDSQDFTETVAEAQMFT